MNFILPLIGIVASFFLLKYRERVGDMIGEAEWMRKVGGVYILIIIFSIFLFFWSLAELTGTTDILFRPLLFFIPGLHQATPEPEL